MSYTFAGYVLDQQRYELRHRDEVVAIEPQVFDLLAYLIAHRDRVVDKRELLDEVWGTRFVTESALTSRVKAARRAVGDDVTDLAPRVQAPTLVLHAANDHRVPSEQGELFAALIPDARFVRLESDNHILLEDEPAWAQFVAEVDAFVAEER